MHRGRGDSLPSRHTNPPHAFHIWQQVRGVGPPGGTFRHHIQARQPPSHHLTVATALYGTLDTTPRKCGRRRRRRRRRGRGRGRGRPVAARRAGRRLRCADGLPLRRHAAGAPLYSPYIGPRPLSNAHGLLSNAPGLLSRWRARTTSHTCPFLTRMGSYLMLLGPYLMRLGSYLGGGLGRPLTPAGAGQSMRPRPPAGASLSRPYLGLI